jgi:hypothetical protein
MVKDEGVKWSWPALGAIQHFLRRTEKDHEKRHSGLPSSCQLILKEKQYSLYGFYIFIFYFYVRN